MVEVPDSTTRYIQSDSGKPTKDLFNWMHSISRQLAGLGSIATHDTSEFLSSTVPCFSVHKNGTNQSIPHNTATVITWSTEIYDVGNNFASNTWTPPTGKVFMCVTTLLTVAATGFQKQPVTVGFFKNGSTLKQFPNYIHSNAFGATSVVNVGTMEDSCNGTDAYTVFINALSNDGSNLTLGGNGADTYFMGHWISP